VSRLDVTATRRAGGPAGEPAGAVPIDVSVPALLKDCTGDQTRFTLAARTLEEAIERLVECYPLLGLHLYDEQHRLRRHVLLYFNDQNIAWLDRCDVPLRPGDRLTVLQNVSGG
jgi:molybdopterin synthase sulfur carrier subunit